MLLISSILILIKLNSAVTFKRDKAIPFNGITIIVLLLSSVLGYEMLFLLSLLSGYGIYSSLYQVSSLTQTFVIFIYRLSIIIFQLSSFFHIFYKYLKHKGNKISFNDSYLKCRFNFKEKSIIPRGAIILQFYIYLFLP